jgi:predicted RNA-binding protein with RPS1 domain
MDTNQKGDIAEANAVVRFMELGYVVSEPINDHSRYDLVVDDGEMNKVQVKYASMDESGRIYVSIKSSNPNTNTSVDKEYTADEVDAYAVYCPDTDSVYWIDYEDAPKKSMHLRVHSKSNHPNINWAKNYEC